MGTVLVLGRSIFPLQPEDLERGGSGAPTAHWDSSSALSPPQSSAGTSSMWRRGTGADRLPQLFLSLLNPNARGETGDSGNGTGPSLSPCQIHLWRLLRSSSMWAGSDPYQASQGTWYTSFGKSSRAAGASHWDFPWTSPRLVFF